MGRGLDSGGRRGSPVFRWERQPSFPAGVERKGRDRFLTKKRSGSGQDVDAMAGKNEISGSQKPRLEKKAACHIKIGK